MMRKLKACALALLVACVLVASAGCTTGAGTSSSAASQAVSEQVSTASAVSDQSAAASVDAARLDDGEYQIEVALAGGSGKATVESPAKLIVDGGAMQAVIVWSSPNYDQMIVDGQDYYPVPRAGNSTFEIPVAALDEDLAVQAETTAMSEPHMIDYTLRFDSSTLIQGQAK